MVNRLPRREPRVRRRVPVFGQFHGLQQPNLAATRYQDASIHHTTDAGVLGLRQRLGHAVLTLSEARLLEPRQRPAAVRVEVALLLGQRLVERLVDERQRLTHRNRLALGVEHLRVAGVDRHARADGRLRKIHRRDIAALQMGERHGQLGLKRGHEIATSGGRCIGSVRAADKDDAGGEGVGALSDHSTVVFCPHRPGAGDGEAGFDNGGQEGVPASAGGTALSIALALRLLEGVVDGYRKGRVRLLGEAVHRLGHAVEKEGLRLFLAAVAVGSGYKLLGLGHGESGKEFGKDRLQRAA